MTMTNQRFSFVARPKPVSGDMRIAWRLSTTILILYRSRGNKCSLAKLHLLNDAIRSTHSRAKLFELISKSIPFSDWRMRVEPAFSRNLDFLVGEDLAKWLVSSNRATLQLTEKGVSAAEKILEATDVLITEKHFLDNVSSAVTETFVKQVVTAGHKLL